LPAQIRNVISNLRIEDRAQILEKGVRAAKVSTVMTVMLACVKATVGLLSGSIALLADAVHSFSDLFSSFAVWFGLKLSERRPSEKFPYGLYKAETLAFLAVAIVVVVSGAEIFVESFKRILSPSVLSHTPITLSVAAVSGFLSLLLSRYKSRAGRITNSQALQAEAKHSTIDVWSSMLVFVGVLIHWIGFGWAEAFAGLLIGLLVITLGLRMGKDAVLVLLDACLKPELVSKARTIAMAIDGVKGVHDIKMRRSGPFIFGEMHVEVDGAMPVDKAAWISDLVEKKIRDSIGELDSLTVHTEPLEKEVYRIVIPVERDEGLNSKISEHFGKAPYFLFIDLYKGKPTHWFVFENEAAKKEKKRGIEAAHLLVGQKADILVAKEVGEGPYHVLRDSGIQMLDLGGEPEIKHVLQALARKELRNLTSTM
jgi:cation diffusion facilitator family transporter